MSDSEILKRLTNMEYYQKCVFDELQKIRKLLESLKESPAEVNK